MISASRNNMNNFFVKVDDDDRAKRKKTINKFKHKYGDHLTILNMFEKYEKIDEDDRIKYCKDNYLKKKTFEKARRAYKRSRTSMIDFENLDIEKSDKLAELELHDRVIACLLYGYRLQIATKQKKGYMTEYSKNVKIDISRSSFLKDKSPKMVFYHELFISGGTASLNIVSTVPTKVIQ